MLRGTEFDLSVTKDGNAKARAMFEKAIALDPKYAVAYGYLGSNYFAGWPLGFSPDPNSVERALQLEQQAVALDDSLAAAHSTLGEIYAWKGQYDQAVTETQRGIALHPNSASGYGAGERPGETVEAGRGPCSGGQGDAPRAAQL